MQQSNNKRNIGVHRVHSLTPLLMLFLNASLTLYHFVGTLYTTFILSQCTPTVFIIVLMRPLILSDQNVQYETVVLLQQKEDLHLP